MSGPRRVWPDGREEIILDVPRFDFNWQLHYALESPLAIPAGPRVGAERELDPLLANWHLDQGLDLESRARRRRRARLGRDIGPVDNVLALNI